MNFKDQKMPNLMNLKCEGIELWGNSRTFRRFDKTKKWLVRYISSSESNVLDIGGQNEFGMRMAKCFGLQYNTTIGDLNSSKWYAEDDNIYDYDVVFVFEVLEHLTNPQLFLKCLKDYISDETFVFVTYPTNPLWLWGDRHFNEYTKDRFYTLLALEGYEVIDYEWNRAFRDWWTLFTGFRPIVRFLSRVFGFSRDNFYLVRLTNG